VDGNLHRHLGGGMIQQTCTPTTTHNHLPGAFDADRPAMGRLGELTSMGVSVKAVLAEFMAATLFIYIGTSLQSAPAPAPAPAKACTFCIHEDCGVALGLLWGGLG